MNPVSAFDTELGLWVRAVAIGDGEDTAVLAVVDGEGWMWDYATKCERCVAKQLTEDLGDELGIDPAGLGFAAGGFLIVNYEDSYSIDRCFGDMVLETTLQLMRKE
jgi:hypothetical protein